MLRKRHVVVAVAILALGLTVPGVAGAAAAGALALEARLNAPCCFNGTLDIHDSDLAKTLRSEIEHRLAAGETADTIQADFVARYGDRVVAARSESPIRALGLSLAALAVVAAAALALALRRWTRRQEGPPTELPRHDQLDARIDAELADLDAE